MTQQLSVENPNRLNDLDHFIKQQVIQFFYLILIIYLSILAIFHLTKQQSWLILHNFYTFQVNFYRY